MLAAPLVLPGAPFLPHAAVPAVAQQAQQDWHQEDGFRWRASPGLEDVGAREAEHIAKIFDEAREWTGLPPNAASFDVIWVADHAQLERELGHEAEDWFAAVAIPFQRKLIIATEIAGNLSQLRSTLRHELMHLAMADLGPQGWSKIPAWFHEGCAEQFAGEVYLGNLGVSLAWRAWRNDLPALSVYREDFGGEALHAAVGYALGHAFVGYLELNYGEGTAAGLLQAVRDGTPFETALIQATGLSQVRHEERMREQLSSLAGLLGDVYQQIFLVLALLLIVLFPFAWRRRRRRHQEFVDRWERDARRSDLDPVLASGQWREVGQEPHPEDRPPRQHAHRRRRIPPPDADQDDAEPLEDWIEDEW